MKPVPLWEHMDAAQRAYVQVWCGWDTGRLLVKREGERIVGAAFVNDAEHADFVNIDFIFVHPEHRRRGVATALMRALLGWERGHYVAVADNDGSEAFFTTFGLKRVDNKLMVLKTR
jgi:GNAT superfamily N-acetyltransferase